MCVRRVRHTSVVTTRSLFSMRGEWVTMKTSMLLRRGTSHVRVQKALWSYCAEKSVEMHSSLSSKVAYVRWRWCVAHLWGS